MTELTLADWERLKREYADEHAMRIVHERVIGEQQAEIERLRALLAPQAQEEGD